ncbi:YbfB/YjiJ family MFS transporter [Streptomyces chiangmaiensis]|uniref:YbfB/YjiJ family MFS transporter n=1 Tax=Streptomyces chiangmaiensis TaxID=766497 RepID=A0ABU7FBR1_9ACTN|nr:YbfB/YjiJ family MFS transporter [Streptomyces chiangmaiensis]MED7821329.1 YbfB/YjiJ family MFS transporter [Streptomyces chiangmaiensis]
MPCPGGKPTHTCAPHPPGPAPWHAIAAGASASFVGSGLARFAYTPLLPELINAHWFSPSAVAYLGAANLAGCLVGALVAPAASRGDSKTDGHCAG